jgi:hypothetical protein
MVARIIATALVAALGGPLASPWVLAAGAGPGCRDGVCVCAHHAGGTPAQSPKPCHDEGESQKARCELRAACHHELTGVTALPPYLLPVAEGLRYQPATEAVAAIAAQPPLPGLRSVEPQPPRAA